LVQAVVARLKVRELGLAVAVDLQKELLQLLLVWYFR
jgi:hypothetical protein